MNEDFEYTSPEEEAILGLIRVDRTSRQLSTRHKSNRPYS